MISSIIPKLPMRNKLATRQYYEMLGFASIGSTDYAEYLMMQRDGQELHFFLFETIDPAENDGQVYIRTSEIDALYAKCISHGIAIHPNGALEVKPWCQKEFSLLDPDNNLLTFGQSA